MIKSSPKNGRSIDYLWTKIRLTILGQGFEYTDYAQVSPLYKLLPNLPAKFSVGVSTQTQTHRHTDTGDMLPTRTCVHYLLLAIV